MLRYAKRIATAIIGTTVLLIGIILLVTPGPAVVVIPIGLAILATEFAWARRWLRVMRDSADKGADKLKIRSFFSRKPKPNEKDSNPGQ